MNWRSYRKPATVGQRRTKAAKARAALKKQGKHLEPIEIPGRTIATTFWGKAWCQNLESYRDYASRLPRGRSYVRSGSVLDLKLLPGKIEALVQGSRRYRVKIDIKRLPRKRWEAFKQRTSGRISSAIALLSGELSEDVLQQIVAPDTGLFPKPAEISLDCDCPDWAIMCKHVAAVLYGVGHRLDSQPELLFTLRQVDAGELITHVTSANALTGGANDSSQSLSTGDPVGALSADQLGDLFGIELDSAATPTAHDARTASPSSGKKAAASTARKTAGRKTASKKTPGKKVVARSKAVSKKTASKKTPGKKVVARSKAVNKKTASKKTPGKKTASKKALGKRTARKKTINRKAVSKKAVRVSASW